MSGDCTFVYADLTHPDTTIYVVLFIFIGLFAALGNALALVILLLSRIRSKTNSVLMSLALSDALVGCILCPYTVYQLIESETRKNCEQEFVRIFLSISFIGTSAINVGYIAYDRYMLLTRLNIQSSRQKTILFLIISWIFPPACVALDWVNIYLYNIVAALIIIVPLIALTTFYFLITKAITRKKKQLFKIQFKTTKSERTVEARNDVKIQKTLHNDRIKLAKQVIFLVVFYIICLLPSAVAVLLNMVYVVTKTAKPISSQNFFLFTLFAAASNSCINPIIYALKYPEFQRTLRKLFCKRKMQNLNTEVFCNTSNIAICTSG